MNVQVFLWGTLVGILIESGEGISFEYDKEFLRSGIEICPLMMPLSGNTYSFPGLSAESFHGLPGMFADSLPDRFGNAVISAWLEKNNRDAGSMSATERLCYTGKRGMGALEYIPELPINASASLHVEVDELTKLASEILESRKNISARIDDSSMKQIISVGTSAGGARAKAVIAINETTGEIKSGQVDAGNGYTYWLIKFDRVKNNRDKEDEDDHEHTRIEYAYYKMAIDAGIEMKESRLFEKEGAYHFLTKRFDRSDEGDKYHMLSLAGMAHYDYNIAGENSYEDVSGILRKLELGHEAQRQLFVRMVFNVMAKNHDDHVKNISFLMDRTGQWSLSPAYDITYAYNPGGAWTGSHQMRINGKRDGIDHSDLTAAGKVFGLSDAEINSAIDRVMCSIEKWKEYAEAAKVSESNAERIWNALGFIV